MEKTEYKIEEFLTLPNLKKKMLLIKPHKAMEEESTSFMGWSIKSNLTFDT